MKTSIIIATILISLISATHQTENKFVQALDCLKTESVSNLTGLVMDLYYNKIPFTTFWGKFLEWGVKNEAQIVSKCIPTEIVQKKVGSSTILTKIGLSLLYASNCEKDLGPSLIVLDNVISNLQNIKTEWKSALTNAFVFGMIGYQSFKDCKSAVETIIEIWNH